ncbi:hypothetical protein NQ315_008972 [Exocentrus adspersus]|uniref:Chromo domain-containing protein n=1 Tax=Exocentrus adspersus TaxID=1586481 RepID=A0AAV8VIK8_9CUCU|nr:hypothetical protein NQ315_008972 [Exocentrus adspersus]
MKKYNINHYNSTCSVKKASMAERVIHVLPEITDNYNESHHSTTGYKPIDVTKSTEELILNTVYNHIKISGVKMFKIIAVKITNPITSLLEDMRGQPIQRAFYARELQKTANPDVYMVEKVLRRKGQQIYVKWLGLDKS